MIEKKELDKNLNSFFLSLFFFLVLNHAGWWVGERGQSLPYEKDLKKSLSGRT